MNTLIPSFALHNCGIAGPLNSGKDTDNNARCLEIAAIVEQIQPLQHRKTKGAKHWQNFLRNLLPAEMASEGLPEVLPRRAHERARLGAYVQQAIALRRQHAAAIHGSVRR